MKPPLMVEVTPTPIRRLQEQAERLHVKELIESSREHFRRKIIEGQIRAREQHLKTVEGVR